MSKLIINGGNRLIGEAGIQGSKNSVLPILAATVLVKGESVIENCPLITDVEATVKILRYLGCKVKREGHTVTVDSTDADKYDIPDDLMREMRSSVVFLGAIIGRMGMPYPKRAINIITIIIDAPQDEINTLSGKIGKLSGITSKVMYSNV